MPHIRIRGARVEQVRALSETIGAELAPILGTTPDNFTVEHIATQFMSAGRDDAGYPFVEVLWFTRSDEIKQRCATHLTNRLKVLTGAADVAVVFQAIATNDYFENGKHF